MIRNRTLIESRWDDAAAARLDPLARLVYRSNLLGADPRIVNSGGGNTSAKLAERDPLSGAALDVLWVKGSGGDLRSANAGSFAALELGKLALLRQRYLAMPERGTKSTAEDAMVALYAQCAFALNPRAASIDTPLHAFIPYAHVDHTHPDAVIALAAARDGEAQVRAVYGDEVAWLPWQRPGFELGLRLQELCRARPKLRGAVLAHHGLIAWADDDRACYDTTVELIERAAQHVERRLAARGDAAAASSPPRAELSVAQRRAILVEILPWLRGRLGGRPIATVHEDESAISFSLAGEAPRLCALGTSCPDHFLRTRVRPLLADWRPNADGVGELRAALERGLEIYRSDYAAYHQRCRRSDSPALRGGDPTVIIIPGIGLIGWGKDKSESRITAEFFARAIAVMRGAEAFGGYTALPEQEAFDVEYWALEEAKLRRQPPEREWSRTIAAVFGAAGGIGREVAQRLAGEGAHVACVDLSAEGAAAVARALVASGAPVAGSCPPGASDCGIAIAAGADCTQRESVRVALEDIVLAYGGVDAIAITAGLFVAPDGDGRIADHRWADTFAVNVAGVYLVADEAARIWKNQGLPASLVVATSANAVVAKRGSLAYDTSKAAANHLVRELAVELAPLVRVNAVAPATVIQGSAMFPRDRVLASLAKYRIAHELDEPDDALIGKLQRFYAERTLCRATITPADQAEAFLLLLGKRLGRTTGHILPVDGGLSEAFLR